MHGERFDVPHLVEDFELRVVRARILREDVEDHDQLFKFADLRAGFLELDSVVLLVGEEFLEHCLLD